jgi:hypothetical protein
MVDVAVVALGHKGEGLGHSLGRLEESVPPGLFAEGEQHLCDQGLQHIQVCRSAIPFDVFNLPLTSPPDYLLSHAASL